jgi:hypothetical protein
MIRRGDGAYEVHLESGTTVADLVFAPRLAPPPVEQPGEWVIAAPLCRVDGSIRARNDVITISDANGYHDHHYATRPMRSPPGRWFRGRLLLGDHAMAFQSLEGSTQSAQLVGFDRAAVDARTVRWRMRGAWPGFICPKEIILGDEIRLARPRVLRASWVHATAAYDATVHGRPAVALCEFAYRRI